MASYLIQSYKEGSSSENEKCQKLLRFVFKIYRVTRGVDYLLFSSLLFYKLYSSSRRKSLLLSRRMRKVLPKRLYLPEDSNYILVTLRIPDFIFLMTK